MLQNEKYQVQVLKYLSEVGQADTRSLTRMLDVSESSLSRVMKEMVVNQLVQVSEVESVGPGRPAQTFRVMPFLAYAVGVEMGATAMRWALINAVGDVLKHGEYPMEVPVTNSEFLERIGHAVSVAIDSADFPISQLLCIGVGIRGFVDHENGNCIYCASVPGPRNIPVGPWLRERFNLPVTILEDGRAVAVVESQLGSMQSVPNSIALNIGYSSIGTGIIINRKLYLGETNMAGHLAHISVDPTGPACVCGAQGCVEVMSTGRAVVETVSSSVERHSITSITVDDGAPSLEEIAQAAEQGDKLCYQVLNRVGELTGIGIGTLIKVLNINRVVMYGTMPRVSRTYMDAVRRSVKLNSLPQVDPIISVSSLPTGTISHGAAFYALNRQLATAAEYLVQRAGR